MKWDNNVKNSIKQNNDNINQLSHFIQPERNHKVNAYYHGDLSDKLSLNIHFDWLKGDEEVDMSSHYAEMPDDILSTQSTRDYDLYAGKEYCLIC